MGATSLHLESSDVAKSFLRGCGDAESSVVTSYTQAFPRRPVTLPQARWRVPQATCHGVFLPVLSSLEPRPPPVSSLLTLQDWSGLCLSSLGGGGLVHPAGATPWAQVCVASCPGAAEPQAPCLLGPRARDPPVASRPLGSGSRPPSPGPGQWAQGACRAEAQPVLPPGSSTAWAWDTAGDPWEQRGALSPRPCGNSAFSHSVQFLRRMRACRVRLDASPFPTHYATFWVSLVSIFLVNLLLQALTPTDRL